MITTLLLAAVLSLIAAQLTNFLNPFSRLNFESAKPYAPVKKPKTGTKGKEHNAFRDLMAIAKYAGTGVVGLSGKIAGTVFQSNGVVRVWKKPVNVINAFTQRVRGIFSGTSSSYKTLTSSQVLGWVGQSSLFFQKHVFGATRPLKGITLFQRVNNALTAFGLANWTDAPGVAVPVLTPTGVTGAAAAGAATFTLDIPNFQAAATIPSNGYVKVYATRLSPVSQVARKQSAYKLIGVFPAATSLTAMDIEADYIARFGALQAGQNIGFAIEAYTITTGPETFWQGSKIYGNTIVTA